MELNAFTVGPLGVNCYLLYDRKSKDGLVIDPGEEGERILDTIHQQNINVKYIINTHGHADHIGANALLKKETGARLCIHAADQPMLEDSRQNLSAFCGSPVVSPAADTLLSEGDSLSLGSGILRILHTPGHSAGGICLYTDGLLFSGDSLFAESIGRCDFPGGDMEQLVRNIKQKLLVLPEDTVVYPGHGPASNIGWERLHNPYLR